MHPRGSLFITNQLSFFVMSQNDFKTIVSQFYREGKRESIHAIINVFITFPSAMKLTHKHTNNIWWEEK